MTNIFIAIGIFFSTLSSLRTPYLPEFQLLLIAGAILFVRRPFFIASLLLTVLCSHVSAIADLEFRFAATSFPSIYTKQILWLLKGIDIIAILLFLYSFKLGLKPRIMLRLPLPWMLFPIALLSITIGYIYADEEAFSALTLLFLTRNFLLFYGIVALCYSCTNLRSLRSLAVIASATWIAKMTTQVLFPMPNLWERPGGTVYFAGEEYATLGLYLAVYLLCYTGRWKRTNWLSIIGLSGFALFLCILSDRRQAFILFTMVVIMLFSYGLKSSYITRLCSLVVLLLATIAQAIVLLFMTNMFSERIQSFFIVDAGLLLISFEAVRENLLTNLLNFLIGIGGATKYFAEVPFFLDGAMAWGPDAFTNYRTTLWYFPFGRLIMDIGFGGMAVYLFYVIRFLKNAKTTAEFYLIINVMSACVFQINSPIGACALGVAAATLLLMRKTSPITYPVKGQASKSINPSKSGSDSLPGECL